MTAVDLRVSLSMNVTDLEKHRYQSVDDACKLVEKGSYLAKIDLKSAYRSVPISKHSMKVTGL